jgi:hypothetical protein
MRSGWAVSPSERKTGAESMMRLSCDDMPSGGTTAGAVFENLLLRSVNSPELFPSSVLSSGPAAPAAEKNINFGNELELRLLLHFARA